jgi:signal peptidase I
MTAPPSADRQPWIAAVLSLLATGLGHIYCGRIATGLVLFLAVLAFAPIIVLASRLSPSTAVLVGLIVALLAVVGVMMFAVVDAYRVCRRVRDQFEPRDYNCGFVYALFIFVGVTYPLGIVQYVRASVYEAFLIPTASEVPNVLPGDHVLVRKIDASERFPKRGDTVIFVTPDRQQTWIKRVIALPGDSVAVRKNEVIVNGKKLEHERVPAASLAAIREYLAGEVVTESNAGARYLVMLGGGDEPAADFAEKTVPEGHCFVLADNRDRSLDSRGVGFVPLANIIGYPQYIYYPAATWSRFGIYAD